LKTPRPIEEAKSASLRGSIHALRRAARRARQLAAQEGSTVVIFRDGKVEYVQPESVQANSTVHEKSADYADKP
jgi:hypothetical protein